MKVAFTTEDMKRVDAHFGWARSIMVYNITGENYTLDKTYVFDGVLEQDGNEDKIMPKLEAIKDCAIVYVADIGGPAAARVVASKIHPVKAKNLEAIEDLIREIQKVMKGTPPPWLRKAMMKDQDAPRNFE